MDTSIESLPLAAGEDACGIYFLVRDGKVIYIGQSTSIARRVATHRKTLEFDEIRYVKVEPKALDKAERKFILQVKPPLNGLTRSNGTRDYCEPREAAKTRRLTGGQLQKLLDLAGLSQRGAAKELGINERTMRKYVAGDAKIPTVVEYALRWIVHQQDETKRLTR